jgi:hypothetical protein
MVTVFMPALVGEALEATTEQDDMQIVTEEEEIMTDEEHARRSYTLLGHASLSKISISESQLLVFDCN